MKHSEFMVGNSFMCDKHQWVVTDIGARTIIAIQFMEGWMLGPPYALAETVFDENDQIGCTPCPNGSISILKK